MSTPPQTHQRTIHVSGRTTKEVCDEAMAVATSQPGEWRVESLATGLMRVHRSSVRGVLRRRVTASCTISVDQPEPGVVRILLSGSLAEDFGTQLDQHLATSPVSDPSKVDQPVQADPAQSQPWGRAADPAGPAQPSDQPQGRPAPPQSLIDAVPLANVSPPPPSQDMEQVERTVMAGGRTTPRTDATSGTTTTGGAAKAYLLQVDTGASLIVTGRGLIGRDPSPGPGEAVDHLLAVGDPQRSLSKTHLEVGVDATGLWVVDRHSTNGSALQLPDGRRVPCLPGQRTPVPEGSLLLIGQRTVRITRT